MNLNQPCPPELMGASATDPAAAAAAQPEQLKAMVAALQAGINEAMAITAIEKKMRQGGLSPERGDFAIVPLAWKTTIKNPPPWMSFSAMLVDKPIFSPAHHLELAR